MILIQKFVVTVEIYFCMVIVRRYFEGLKAQTCLKERRACLFETRQENCFNGRTIKTNRIENIHDEKANVKRE